MEPTPRYEFSEACYASAHQLVTGWGPLNAEAQALVSVLLQLSEPSGPAMQPEPAQAA